MCEFNPKNDSRFIDPCLKGVLADLKRQGVTVIASCCGHDKYPKTIIITEKSGRISDLISGITIPRKKRFYRKDVEGYYYIPELMEQVN